MTTAGSQLATTPESTVLCELGSLGIARGDHWSSVRGARSSTLVAALGLAGSAGVGTDELVETIWPSPGQPATARQSLANLVLRLRRANGPSFISSTRHGYRIGDDVGSHRRSFLDGIERAGELLAHLPGQARTHADDALALWRGEPWSGIERPAAVEADRAAFVQARCHALRLSASASIALDQPDLAVPLVREVLGLDPFDELAHHLLARAQVALGQRAAAIRTIQNARRTLAERGLTLDASLSGTEQRLLSPEFSFESELNTLPANRDEFVGRSSELAVLAEALDTRRLVTLQGIGGGGKTRLAIEVASMAANTSGRGFVDLAATRSSRQVQLAFARGLGLPANHLDGLDADQRLEALANGVPMTTTLLVVDNCEHVISDVCAVVERLIRTPGPLTVLATSRVPLEIAGEYRYRLPDFGDGPELFVRRAALRGSGVALDSDRDVIEQICRLVDHLPLAIEIAAAQTPYRTLVEIVDELRTGEVQRDASQSDPRHETVAATIRWSHDLLEESVADGFVRLGVFGAGFERSDAAAVIEPHEVDVVLDTLVRYSLVERHDLHGRSRYRLPVPVQQYCAAELAGSDRTVRVRVALADWLLAFTDREPGDAWMRFELIDALEARFVDVLAAVTGLRSVGRVDDATRLAARLGGAANLFGRSGEVIDVLTELLADCDDDEARADGYVSIVYLAEVERRHQLLGSTLGFLDALDGEAGRRNRVFVHCLHALWMSWAARLTDYDYGPANAELERARRLEGRPASRVERSYIEVWQSGIHLFEADWPAAEAAARRSLEDSFGTTIDTTATECLCHARVQLGDPETAIDLASNHPDRHRETTYGDRLGIVGAIARVQLGDVDAGLAEIRVILAEARRATVSSLQDEAAIAIAFISHLLAHDDLTLRILDTGVAGRGPWVGYLVPKICRDLGIVVTGDYGTSADDRVANSDRYGAAAGEVLSELEERSVETRSRAASAG